jgi:hypothetical protein
MKGTLIKIGLIFGLVIVLLSTNITPGLLGRSNDSVQQKSVDALFIPTTEKSSVFSLNVFGTTNLKKQEVALSVDDATLIFEKLRELKSEMTQHPYSEKTQSLKIAFVDLLDEKGLIPDEVSKETYLALLNPRWVERLQKTGNPASSLPQPFANRGTCALCSLGGEGSGILLPLFLLPRPRIAVMWLGNGLTTAANLLTSKGYVARGAQTGFAFGFMGIGISYALPGYTLYGFIGYALLASTTAEYVEHYPPNRAPTISDVLPADGGQNIPLSLSELQFRIQDADGDLMSYSVTTEPDIGSGSGNLKPFGVYKVSISGLENDKIYRWTVEVSDGKETTMAAYSFFTVGKPPFDPFIQGWNYRKKITIDHTKVTEDLTNFPILINVIDQDLQDKAQNDGDDILFMDNVGLASKLYHEIEYFDNSTGTLTAWVNIPIVHSTEDTSLYMYYGNLSSTTQQFPEKVWNKKFNAVWHLNNGPDGTIVDSTSNNNDGTAHGGMTVSDLIDGKTGKCLEFDGIDDYISIPDSNSLKPTDVTLIAWYQPKEEKPLNGYFLSKQCYDYWGNSDGQTYSFGINDLSNSIGGGFETNTNQQVDFIGNHPVNINTWSYLALTFNTATREGVFYTNGVLNGVKNPCDSTVLWYNDPWGFAIGGCRFGTGSQQVINRFYNCGLDEIRILDTPVSAGWISTEFNNQNNPAGFLNFGPEVPGP